MKPIFIASVPEKMVFLFPISRVLRLAGARYGYCPTSSPLYRSHMAQLQFSATINASCAHVWRTLWADATYRQWAAVFHEGSYAVSDWQEGSQVLFLGEGQSGMNSRIARLLPGQEMVFEHLGEVHDGVADTRMADAGTSFLESYTLLYNNGATQLTVSINAPDEMAEYMEDTFPAALQQVQQLAESLPPFTVTIRAFARAAKEDVWTYFTDSVHIMHWNNASEDWHTPAATNDVRPGGSFCYTMAARDGSMSFDLRGTFHDVALFKALAYTLEDGRKVEVTLNEGPKGTMITETFETENTFPTELQQAGWQAILDNFVRYTESR